MIAVFIICIAVFLLLSVFVNRQNAQTVTQLGNIYMSSMNDRISKHFGSITDHRISQLKMVAENIPPYYESDKETLKEWITYSGKSRGYESVSYWCSDGSLETVYGNKVEINNLSPLIDIKRTGRGRVAVGYNKDKEQVMLICVPIKLDIPGTENYSGLVGELPISYIEDALSLDEKDSLIYSFVIREDGSFVVRTSDVVRNNYFDRVRAIYSETDGLTPDEYISELQEAIKSGKDYSGLMIINGERRHLHCSSLPNSVWYLITLMPYGALNESVENLGTRSLFAAAAACTVILAALLVVFLRYFRMNKVQMKELEEAKLAADEASKSKSEFLSNMSHDIRTPMNAIVGMTAIASAHINDPKQVSNCLKKITQSSRHLLGLINDVLDMSKIESGKMTLNDERVSLREIMDSIVSIVQPQVKSKNQKFNISIFDIMSENVHCDSVRLNQILINLLSNAIKFTPDGGSIDVILNEKKSPKGEGFVRIQIRIKDTGIGMSEEFRNHIFESFTREDNKRIHKIEGTGLGMAITKYIVDAMGGEISVSSKQGEGTEFLVELDLKRAEEMEEDMILPDWIMLIVDDDQQLCESTAESLRSIGIRAEWVLDGEDAVKMATRHHKDHKDYHVILLDWKLPDMDGIQTARELRRQLGHDVPILLMSAYDWSEIEEDARDAGISGFLMKPLFRSTLYYGLLPFTDDNNTQNNKEEEQAEAFNKRILVAEDNELNWEIAHDLFTDLGMELEWAENGKVCVEMFQKSEVGYYDAILMDIRMPVMDGYGAADAIRGMDRQDAALPIIAMTADAYSDDIQKCLEHGMNAHIAKPIDVKDVVRVLKRCIDESGQDGK